MVKVIKDLTHLDQQEARLLEELQKIQNAKKELEEEAKRENEGKQEVVRDILEIFSSATAFLERTKERFNPEEDKYDSIICQFIDSKISELNQSIKTTVERASEKKGIEQFQKALLKTLTVGTVSALKEEEDDAETPLRKRKQSPDSARELPRGPAMGIVWHFLTSYDFREKTTPDMLVEKIEKKEISYGKYKVGQRYLVRVAKDIFEKFKTMDALIVTREIEISIDGVVYTTTISTLMKSFFRYCESNELTNQQEQEIFKDENFYGPKSIAYFLRMVHIPLLEKEEKSVVQASPESLQVLAKKLNNGETQEVLEKRPEEVLTFGDREVHMAEEKELIKRGSTTSNQLLHLLLKWFNSDIYSLAHLLVKTNMIKLHEDFQKHIELTHKEIDRMVITKEIADLCVKSYAVLQQFEDFVEYYASLHNDSSTVGLYKTKILPLHGIDIHTEQGCKLFLKRALPRISHNRSSVHIYTYFVSFLNLAKGGKMAINHILPRIEEITTEKPTLPEKVAPAAKKVFDNNSELAADRDDDTLDNYLLKTLKLSGIQALADHIRVSLSSKITTDDYNSWDKYLNESIAEIRKIADTGVIPSKEKTNLMIKRLFDYTKGQRSNNVIRNAAKNGPRALNFAKELRLIIRK